MKTNITIRQPEFGTGIYTVSEAARLLRVSGAKAQGWSQGYVWHRKGETRSSGPIIERAGATPGLLTFFDLIELMFVREFRKEGVSLPKIRRVAEKLRQEWSTPYPFATQRLLIDGRSLIEREHLIDVDTGQKVFAFGETLFKDVQFENGTATQWFPLGQANLVVLDPHRSFGTPIELRSGIRTDVLYRMYLAEGKDAKVVAEWYDTDLETVRKAVAFEEQWQSLTA